MVFVCNLLNMLSDIIDAVDDGTEPVAVYGTVSIYKIMVFAS